MNKPFFAVIIIYVLAGIMIWGLTIPEYNSFSQIRSSASQAKEELEKTREIKAKLASLNEEYKAKNEEVEKVFAVLPAKEDIPSLLVQLEALSGQNGLILEGIDFKEESSSGRGNQVSGSALQTEISGSGLSGQNFQALPAILVQKTRISLGLTGSYSSLINFLKAVEKTLRLMDVNSLNFSEARSSSTGGQSGDFNYKIDLTVYYK